MKKTIIKFFSLVIVGASLTGCLKSNNYFEDFSSTQPIVDLPKAPANAINQTNPTSTWFTMDSLPGGQDFQTAVHIAAKDHVGDVTVRMKIDKALATTWLATRPTYKLIPDSLYTVGSLDVTIPNAGVFTTADFVVRIKTQYRSLFKSNNFILPVSIDTTVNRAYTVASNYRTIFWRINVK
jgi:hypothetical protein